MRAPTDGANEAEHPIRQAFKWREMLNADNTLTQSQLAQKQGVSRARVSQIMRLLSLPEEVQNVLLGLKDPVQSRILSERRMRNIALLPDRESQLKAFQDLR